MATSRNLLWLAFLLSGSCWGSQDPRIQAWNELHEPYEQCASEIRERLYDETFKNCMSDPDSHKSRCGHDAQLAATTKPIGAPSPFEVCEKMKPTYEEWLNRVQELRGEK